MHFPCLLSHEHNCATTVVSFSLNSRPMAGLLLLINKAAILKVFYISCYRKWDYIDRDFFIEALESLAKFASEAVQSHRLKQTIATVVEAPKSRLAAFSCISCCSSCLCLQRFHSKRRHLSDIQTFLISCYTITVWVEVTFSTLCCICLANWCRHHHHHFVLFSRNMKPISSFIFSTFNLKISRNATFTSQ